MDAHEAAVRSALRAGDRIGRLIARLGTAEHPRGEVLAAYRNAERGLAEVLRRGDTGIRRGGEAAEVLVGLRRDVARTARQTLSDAVGIGRDDAARQAQAWGLGQTRTGMDVDTAAMEAAWLAVVDAQSAAALALVATGADAGEIVGDDSRAGVLRPAVTVAEGGRWIAGAVSAAWRWWIGQWTGGRGQGAGEWYHQAVAAIDERTTDCCLRVHGQVQRLERPFELRGTPRYADRLDHPPFHWYCRTAEALLHQDQVGDGLTQEMLDAALAELLARGPDGKNRVEIHPSHGRSRR